jgi:hypothetical protein
MKYLNIIIITAISCANLQAQSLEELLKAKEKKIIIPAQQVSEQADNTVDEISDFKPEQPLTNIPVKQYYPVDFDKIVGLDDTDLLLALKSNFSGGAVELMSGIKSTGVPVAITSPFEGIQIPVKLTERSTLQKETIVNLLFPVDKSQLGKARQLFFDKSWSTTARVFLVGAKPGELTVYLPFKQDIDFKRDGAIVSYVEDKRGVLEDVYKARLQAIDSKSDLEEFKNDMAADKEKGLL